MPRSWYIRLLYGLLCLVFIADLIPKSARAQEVEVQALVSETTIGTEETVSFTLEIKGANFSDLETPQPPATEGLALLQPTPFTQRNVSVVNGRMTQSLGLQWNFRPIREGEARIMTTTVKVNGKTYQTQPIRLAVVPQAQRPARPTTSRRLRDPITRFFNDAREEADEAENQSAVSKQDIFIQAQPSARSAYQNEQVTIEYKLFFRNHIQPRHSRLADSWDAEGFWREELDVEARPMPRSSIENGLRYNSIVLKRVAVFPTRSGALTIDPLRIETEVFAPRSNDPFSRFFSTRTPYETIERASPSVHIESKPLPAGAPDGFNGAVGQFEMDAQISRTEVEVGEPIQVTVRLSGTGNLAMLDHMPLHVPGIFETYDPEVNTEINSSGQRVRGHKTFTYLLVPRSNGTFEMAPIEFAYFDPAATQYRTLRSDPMTIRVTGTAMTPLATSTTASGLPVDDIAGSLTRPDWTRIGQTTPLYRSLWTYGLLLFPLLLLGLTYAYRRHVVRLDTDQAYARNRRAHPLARKHLKQAEALLKNDEPRAFYEELERAVLGFIGNRLNVPELALTRAQLDARLATIGLNQTTRDDLQHFLETCDAARFAPKRPSLAQRETSLDQAHQLIVALDAAFSQPTPVSD